MSCIPYHYLSTCGGFFIYLMASEQDSIPDQFISAFLDLSFSKGIAIHSLINYLFSTYSTDDKESTVVGGGGESLNLVGERENKYTNK